jgi:phenylalanyl-tRNA synthetase beta chain
MIISLNWLKQYVDLPDIPTGELATLIGARLVEIEEVTDNTHKYDGIFIVRVVECEDIPDTHLRLTKIDDGGIMDSIDPSLRDEKGYLTVVCGAPNCHASMLAAWIAPGATVPATYHTDAPFVISARALRGHTSQGMLAALDELDLGTDHDGIVELPTDLAQPGTPFTDVFAVNDILFDIENKSLTHRPDCFGIVGFAREVAGILGQPFTTPEWLTASKLFAEGSPQASSALQITISDPDLCPRYSAAVLDHFADESTASLTPDDIPLIASGMRPISKIVDITNYLMLLTGQPLHAFDYDKLIKVGGTDQPHIIVRAARAGETLELLDGRTITLTENDIVITSNDVPVALAGAMGGKNTEIDADTKRVIIESATFSLYNERKTSMHHGIFSEAVTRFTKGQPAALTAPVLDQAIQRLEALGMKLITVADAYPKPQTNPAITVTPAQVNALLGSNYRAKDIQTILEHVGFTVKGDTYTAPYWRTDIHIPEDVIEEVGRLNGYDTLPVTLPTRTFTAPAYDPLLALKAKLRRQLTSLGASEVLTYGFVSAQLLQNAGQDPANSYALVNSISPALEYVRQTLTPSLLEKAYVNLKDGYDHFALYEMNQVYQQAYGQNDEQVPVLRNKLAFVITSATAETTAYYAAKRYAAQLFRALDLEVQYLPLDGDRPLNRPFEPQRAAQIVSLDGKHRYGVIGELKASVRRNFKLPEHTAAFELNLDPILEQSRPSYDFTIANWIARDLTLTVPADQSYADTLAHVQQIATAQQLNLRISPASIYHDGGATKNISFHLQIAAPDAGLSRTAINQIMEKFNS